MEKKDAHTVGTVQKSNLSKIAKSEAKSSTTHIHDSSRSCLGIGT